MKPQTQPHARRARQLSVVWQDCVWFPPVLAGKRSGWARSRRPVYWPFQIITDPNVCVGRALTISNHENLPH